MSTETATLEKIQGLLALQSKVGKPPASICSVIAGLKDLCELNSVQSDWRRGTGGGGQSGGHGHGTFTSKGHHNSNSSNSLGSSSSSSSGRPIFRNSSTSSLSSQGRGGGGGGGGAGATAQMSASSSAPASPSNGRTPFTPQGVHGGPGSGPVRYQSRFKNSSKQVEDKILNNIILSKLNKFSGSTYNDIRDFLYQILGSGEPDLAEMIRDFMMLVFKKAASEEIYCPLYAKLLAEISGRYAVILEEMKKLQSNYLDIFDDIEELGDGQKEDYDAFVEKNKEKQYRQGYSQFLAELAGLEILERSNLELTFQKIFELMLKYGAVADKKGLLEQYADCLVRMSKVLKKKMTPFFVEARASLLKQSTGALNELFSNKDKYPSLSPKARFILMDVKDNLSGV